MLDKNVAGIPWESIPILRGRSVSRIPGVDFLLDRLQYVRQTRGVRGSALVDRFPVDPRNAYFVLNPSGDLKNTEGRFAPWLKEMKSVGWEGIVGRPPSELQLANALTRKDLVMWVISHSSSSLSTETCCPATLGTGVRNNTLGLTRSDIFLDVQRLCSGDVLPGL